MDVSVVITCWNGRRLLENNLPKVVGASKNPKNKIREIVIVDDGSTDDSEEYVNKFKVQSTSRFATKCKVGIVKHEQNLGYAATCNTGVREAKSELVVILNLDVVPSENFLEPALPHFNDEKVFAVSFNEGKFGPGKVGWKNGFLDMIPSVPADKASLTDWPSGGSSIFRKDIWEKLGGMDELFLPFYFEDMDLGLRASKAGYRCLWEPRSKVEHQHESTINPKNLSKYGRNDDIPLVKERNFLLLNWKNLENFNLIVAHLFSLGKRCISTPGYLKIVFAAIKRKLLYIFVG